jgi:16S rRNA (guanine1207-N2)-methyltransferase
VTDILVINDDLSLNLEVAPGVFFQYGIDEGSKILLETAEIPQGSEVLDLGCGCGVLGLAVAARDPEAKVMLVDSDIRAVRLSRLNAKNNQIRNVSVELGDVTYDIPEGKQFNIVISNPPTHQGREVVREFIEGGYKVLKRDGYLYMVVNRLESVLKRLQEKFGNSEKIASRQGYIVFKSIKRKE